MLRKQKITLIFRYKPSFCGAIAVQSPEPKREDDYVSDPNIHCIEEQRSAGTGVTGVTGGMLVQLAAHRGAKVIATAGADSAGRVSAIGADTVLDYHQRDWPEQVRALTGGGVDGAANAVRACFSSLRNPPGPPRKA